LFSFISIKDYHADLLHGRTTSVEAVQYFLRQIELQKHLNAFLEVYADEALSRASQLDEHQAQSGKLQGPLHGVVIGLKDVICYKDHPLTAGSKILEGFTSIYNATAVERLLAAGAIIIGRQNCDEFAMGSSNENSAFGNVLNPLDNNRVPGGSSGGSAVAVQADLCMVSLGSDTGGSVRQPADFCGIVGMKPTYGKISRYGLIAYASSFDQIGIFARSVQDVAIVLENIAGKDAYDSTASDTPVESYSQLLQQKEAPKRIAYFRQVLEHAALDPEIAASFRSFIEELTENGYDVQPVDFEYLDYVVPTYYILTTAEASSNLSRYDGVKYGYRSNGENTDLTQLYNKTRTEGFGKEVQRRILLGTFVLSAGYFDAYFSKAQKIRQLLVQKTKEIFSSFDAIISPTVPSPAFKFGEITDPIEMFLADIYTVFANLTGIPAISLPLFIHSNKMPFGIQVMTFQEKDLCLLIMSEQFLLIAGKN
jgi:aspartyl-tRNA(Asn)/glutamyl-tRNA(Gln) amidotransferase subunit A